MIYYYKIKRGYDEKDAIKIKNDEVQKAILAWLTGSPISIGGSLISGKTITAIEPDIHEMLRLNDGVEIYQEDHAKLRNDGTTEKYKLFIEEQTKIVSTLIEKDKKELVGKVYTLDELIELPEIKRLN